MKVYLIPSLGVGRKKKKRGTSQHPALAINTKKLKKAFIIVELLPTT